jgi:hypothetical protein
MSMINPDREAFDRVNSQYPNATDAEKCQLAQADTLIRISKATTIDELKHMAETGLLDSLIDMHNERTRQA